MEEADKVSSSAPDEGPRDIAMNEAAAVGPTQTDARDAEEERTGKSSPPQTTEETDVSKITEETSAPQTNEVTSTSQTTEVTLTSTPQITEVTSTPQTTEVTNISNVTPQTSEKTSDPQTTEVTSTPQIPEETSIIQTTEETSVSKITEETSSPPTTEVTSPPQTPEVTSSAQPAEESVAPVSEVPVRRVSTEAGVTATEPVITDAAVTPETAEEAVTPPVSEAVTPHSAAEGTSPPRTEASADLSSEAREEEDQPPRTLRPSPSHEPEPAATPVTPAAAPAAASAVAPVTPVAAPAVAPVTPAAAPPAAAPALFQPNFPSVLELLYWRDVKSSALVFGSSLFILLSLTCCSIISVLSYAALALLSITLSFRIYKGVLQAVQKSDEGHPFKWVLEKDVALSSAAVQRHSDVTLSRINGVLKELRRLFLVEDLIDSLKFAVLLWVFTYVGAWFNGLTLLILGLVGAFSGPLTYEKHQTQIDQFISTVNSQMKGVLGKIQAMVPGAKKKPE